MDLFAYSQIADLEAIARDNEIEVPRLRGYRLMSVEEKLSEKDIEEAIRGQEGYLYEYACRSVPRFHPNSGCSEISSRTRRLENKFCIKETRTETRGDGSEYSWEETVGFRWELLHGKARKRLKLALKTARREVRKSLETFNKYAGRSDVLYIHARIGGRNWLYYGGAEIARKPWFLEKVDDYFDSTYCDIYAKIKE